LFECFSEPVEGLSGLSERCFGLIGLLFKLIPKALNVRFSLMRDGASIAPRSFSKHTGAKVDQCNTLLGPLMTVREANARADGEMRGNARALPVSEKGFEHRIRDGVFCKNGVHLFDA